MDRMLKAAWKENRRIASTAQIVKEQDRKRNIKNLWLGFALLVVAVSLFVLPYLAVRGA